MPDTHGFETVAEFAVPFLRKVLRAAWKSGGDEGDPNVIPEFFDIPAGTAFGSWTLADGQAQLPQDELDIAMAPDINGVDLKLGMDVQVEIENPPVPSASVFDLAVDAHVRAPVGTIDGSTNVAILLSGVPLGNVSATLTSGDPVAPRLDAATQEMVHAMYRADGTAFPHTIQRDGQSFGGLYTADIFVELFDDATDPARRIEVTHPTATELAISIPLRMQISDIQRTGSFGPILLSPMACTARLVITAPYSAVPGSVTAQLSAADVDAVDIARAPGVEGDNFDTNNTRLFGQLPTFVRSGIVQEGEQMVAAMADIAFTYPTVAQIEAQIRTIVHEKMVARGALSVWTPEAGSGETQINDVAVKALATALALGVNAGGGADVNALTDFIPGGREFAIGLSAAKVLAAIDEAIHRPESEGGFGTDFPPHTFQDVDGHDARLNSLNASLIPGFIHLSGEITVIDAIPPKIDVDADFDVDTGLHWEDNADGTQRMVSDVGEPEVDLGLLGWILAFILILLSPLGLIGGIVLIVVFFVVESTAESIGGRMVRDSAGRVTGLEALPEQLEHIGEVDAKFENPIEIAPDGMVFSG